jgi:hypothetical protein
MRSRGSAWQASACWCGKLRPGIHVTHNAILTAFFPSGSLSFIRQKAKAAALQILMLKRMANAFARFLLSSNSWLGINVLGYS